jgi:septal ring factor EnvC (AmiA/AmiB activator)
MGVVLPQASSGAAELAAAQARSAGQLQALESQLASKDTALEASQVRLAALEAELKSAHSKVSRAEDWGMGTVVQAPLPEQQLGRCRREGREGEDRRFRASDIARSR